MNDANDANSAPTLPGLELDPRVTNHTYGSTT